MAVPSRKQAQEFFQQIDTSGDGTVCMQELAAVLQANGYSSEQVGRMFVNIDTDSDKRVSEAEFLEDVLKNPRCEALDKAFKDGDRDNSGFLDKSEVTGLGSSAGLTDSETIEKCFQAMDQDGSGKVDKNEFIAYMNEHY